MPRLTNRVPKYCRHKASGQAVVTIQGRDHYLGPWKSKASHLEYDRLIGEWIAAGRPVAGASSRHDITVTELSAAYWKFAQTHYVKNGKLTDAIYGVKVALRLLRETYGHTRAVEFGPLALKAIRQQMIELDLSRAYINETVAKIKRVFKWGVREELLPIETYQALTTLEGLRAGRSAAREPSPVVAMFNNGEIELMREVEMAPVFFGETLIGPNVPNLIYMLSADNMESHKAHWKAFLAHPTWERMKAMEKYKDTVSKIKNWFLKPTSYSQM